jgi:hypothetical protein
MKSNTPKHSHNAFFSKLFDQVLPEHELYKLAMEVETDACVAELESDWAVAIGEGLEEL